MGIFGKKKVVIEEKIEILDDVRKEGKKGTMDDAAPKRIGKLDMWSHSTPRDRWHHT